MVCYCLFQLHRDGNEGSRRGLRRRNGLANRVFATLEENLEESTANEDLDQYTEEDEVLKMADPPVEIHGGETESKVVDDTQQKSSDSD